VNAQNITNKLGNDGYFEVSSTEGFTKFKILNSGEVRWFLDGEDLYIRDSYFDIGDGNGANTKYDFMHIDGNTGRIGFNILADSELPLTSSIHLHGSIATRVRKLDGSENYSIQQDDHTMIIDQSSNSNTTMSLPSTINSLGRELKFKRNGNSEGKIIITPQNGEFINGEQDGEVSLEKRNSSLEVVCSESGWWVISEVEAKLSVGVHVVTSNAMADRVRFIFVHFSANDQTIILTLPDAADYEGQRYEIKRNADGKTYSDNLLIISPAFGNNLDQYTVKTPYYMSNDYESLTVRCNGERWLIYGNYGHDFANRGEDEK